jgi:hypothetical protein
MPIGRKTGDRQEIPPRTCFETSDRKTSAGYSKATFFLRGIGPKATYAINKGAAKEWAKGPRSSFTSYGNLIGGRARMGFFFEQLLIEIYSSDEEMSPD